MKRSFYLNLMNLRGYTGKHMSPSKDMLSVRHELRDGVGAISDALLELGGDEGDSLRLVEADTAGQSALGEETCLEMIH